MKTFKNNGIQVPVLTGVDLDIPQGETIAVVGASGVGKSTLLHILGTLERPSSGEILWEGSNVFAMDDKPWRPFAIASWGLSSNFITCSLSSMLWKTS